ncbi:hypothetical protein SLE2022_207960 [Rubroshorea leprosula]
MQLITWSFSGGTCATRSVSRVVGRFPFRGSNRFGCRSHVGPCGDWCSEIREQEQPTPLYTVDQNGRLRCVSGDERGSLFRNVGSRDGDLVMRQQHVEKGPTWKILIGRNNPMWVATGGSLLID